VNQPGLKVMRRKFCLWPIAASSSISAAEWVADPIETNQNGHGQPKPTSASSVPRRLPRLHWLNKIDARHCELPVWLAFFIKRRETFPGVIKLDDVADRLDSILDRSAVFRVVRPHEAVTRELHHRR
jgi:hypothetical protein